MATQLQSAEARAGLRRLVASEVSEALTRQPGLAKTTAANTAQIVAAIAAAVIALPPAQQRRLKSKSADVADLIAAFARDDTRAERIAIPEPAEVEPRKGSGFGELIDIEEGRRRLSAYSIKGPLEEWAGPVAGSSALRDRGIARSTLHDWQRRDQVVALLVGARKHAFPLEQFVDGRPVEGIADILKIVGNPRRAWLWLVQQSPLLGNMRPIDLLKRERKDEVVEAARTVFEYP
ncbi:antitoxin Xre/MbcA/ParS-like domain-containing protein [Sphingopyxis sp. 113P3]|jgi:hypothetical protein|uniref:antitoxin Xre/MbcA/ParS-like domain-containing protein n=1 Tax=Sphingopyxis sp. (strain 113P3) TaxID=292913 RepID=UPI0006AD0C42|nr:hypothetical protein [Sphingopyxis sp. 113P3]ALC11475.1 hypothetical protein LH20_05860 [Sphingopyxis sp. 113P3]